MKLYEPQSAHLMYAFDGGWQVMRYVREHVFKRTSANADTYYISAQSWAVKARDADNILTKYWQWMGAGGFGLAGISQYFAAIIVVALFVVMQFLFLTIWAGLSVFLIAILSFINFIYGTVYRIFVRCPSCHEQMNIPVYICPNCVTEHTRLWPSMYGVFHHRCTCNTKLPTLDALGRRDLIQKCVHCKEPMNSDVGRLVNIHIPVIGGPSAGKSNYMFTAVHQFIEDFAKPLGYEVEFPDEKHRQMYERNVEALQNGRELVKTTDKLPHAYNISIKRPGQRVGRIIYMYDPAGEAYLSQEDTVRQSFFKYVDGIIFVIDPFSIDLYRLEHETEVNNLRQTIRPSQLNPMQAYERVLDLLESTVDLQRGRKFPHPIAVVLTKADALTLDREVGISAANRLVRKKPEVCFTEDAISLLAERFLQRKQQGNLVRDLHNQFSKVAFFSSSALGRLPDPDMNNSQPFQPDRVLDPLLWILANVNAIKRHQNRSKIVDKKHRELRQRKNGLWQKAKFYYWDSLKPYRGE